MVASCCGEYVVRLPAAEEGRFFPRAFERKPIPEVESTSSAPHHRVWVQVGEVREGHHDIHSQSQRGGSCKKTTRILLPQSATSPLCSYTSVDPLSLSPFRSHPFLSPLFPPLGPQLPSVSEPFPFPSFPFSSFPSARS
eukprot:RCo030566